MKQIRKNKYHTIKDYIIQLSPYLNSKRRHLLPPNQSLPNRKSIINLLNTQLKRKTNALKKKKKMKKRKKRRTPMLFSTAVSVAQ